MCLNQGGLLFLIKSRSRSGSGGHGGRGGPHGRSESSSRQDRDLLRLLRLRCRHLRREISIVNRCSSCGIISRRRRPRRRRNSNCTLHLIRRTLRHVGQIKGKTRSLLLESIRCRSRGMHQRRCLTRQRRSPSRSSGGGSRKDSSCARRRQGRTRWRRRRTR